LGERKRLAVEAEDYEAAVKIRAEQRSLQELDAQLASEAAERAIEAAAALAAGRGQGMRLLLLVFRSAEHAAGASSGAKVRISRRLWLRIFEATLYGHPGSRFRI